MVNAINMRYPLLEKMDSYPEYGDAGFFEPIINKRHKAKLRRINFNDRAKAAAGALLGTTLPLACMMKKQRIKNPLKLNYGLSDMIMLSATSVVGGVACGMIGESKPVKKNKLQEGLFQFLNAAVPTWIVGGTLKLAEGSKIFNNTIGKIFSMIGGLFVGMYGAAALANIVCDPKDKFPDRKLKLADCVANVDDAIGVLVLAKFPIADKLHIDKMLPIVYSYCGYRAGKSN